MKTMLVLVITLLMTANSWADGPNSNESDVCVNCRPVEVPGAPDVPVDTSTITHTSIPWYEPEDPVYQDMSPAAARRLIADYRGLRVSGHTLSERERAILCHGGAGLFNNNQSLSLFSIIGGLINRWRTDDMRTPPGDWREPSNFRFIVMWWNEYGEQVECEGEPLLKIWLRTRRTSLFNDHFLLNPIIQANRASIPLFDVTSSNNNYPRDLKEFLGRQANMLTEIFEQEDRRTATVD